LFDKAFRLLRIVVLLEIHDADVSAFFRERDRDRATDAAIATGDERDLHTEFAATALAWIVACWARSHDRLSAGLPPLRLTRDALYRGHERARCMPRATATARPPSGRHR